MKQISGKRSRRAVVGAFTAALLGAAVAVAPLAGADEVPLDGAGEVDITVSVEDIGDLFMTVDTSQPVVLSEVNGDPENRTFTGQLPIVTVTDTRSNVPTGPNGEEIGWSVVGQASDFVHADEPNTKIPNENLGWVPELVDEPAGNDGVANAGFEVESVSEGGDGLTTGVDLLVFAFPSEAAQAVSQEWKATAELRLAAPESEVIAGDYAATLTLSLFEY